MVTATDADEDRRLHYEITNGNVRGRFAITLQNGEGLITVAQPLDYKQEKRYVLTVTASDSGGRTDTATVYVNVSDANNFAPVFENAPYAASVSIPSILIFPIPKFEVMHSSCFRYSKMLKSAQRC